MMGFALTGLLATFLMDAWTYSAFCLGWATPPSPQLIGRWLGHQCAGKLTHEDIRQSPPIRHEGAGGLLGHYAIGAILGVAFHLLSEALGIPKSQLFWALGFGLG